VALKIPVNICKGSHTTKYIYLHTV